MASATDLIPPLSMLTKACIDHGAFGYVENFCNLLVALDSGRWSELPDDEQYLWLNRLADLLHVRGLGDAEWTHGGPSYERARALCDALLRAHEKAR